jgi:hypothetical protein
MKRLALIPIGLLKRSGGAHAPRVLNLAPRRIAQAEETLPSYCAIPRARCLRRDAANILRVARALPGITLRSL